MSTYLANQGFRVTAVDNEQGMINIARKISKNYDKEPVFIKKDINKLDYPTNYFGIVFSHGVLEHFSDEQIVSLLKQQLKISRTLIFSIPTNYLDERKDRYYGNERFLSFSKWKDLISKTGCKTIEVFGFHYIMGWKKYWDIVIRGKIFGPSPYLTFVLKKNR
jgi:2-polyprenyl-3-methyl-5-hydroxy-6-metoxy-1,4-benzoquinol methylase